MTAVNWKSAPKHARWWAMDGDGKAYWYCAPDVAPFTTFWSAEAIDAPNFGYTGDWRKSLTEKPASED